MSIVYFLNDARCFGSRLCFLLQAMKAPKSDGPLRHRYSRFYIRGSVHRNSRLKKSNEMHHYVDIYLLLNHSTCFGRPSLQSSGVHKTVVAASGTDHTVKYRS
jgi:hypothetical protein